MSKQLSKQVVDDVKNKACHYEPVDTLEQWLPQRLRERGST